MGSNHPDEGAEVGQNVANTSNNLCKGPEVTTSRVLSENRRWVWGVKKQNKKTPSYREARDEAGQVSVNLVLLKN